MDANHKKISQAGMDASRAGKNEPLSADTVAREARTPFTETSGGGRCTEDGGDDAAGLNEGGWQERVVDAGDLGDGAGHCRRTESDQCVALSGSHQAARRGISQEGVWRVLG